MRGFSSVSAASASSTSSSVPLAGSSPTVSPAVHQADGGVSFWQPKPANGYVVVRASPWFTPGLPFSQGLQVLPPGGAVRSHAHAAQMEVITVVKGSGHALIGGQRYPMHAGTTLTLPPNVEHSFHNNHTDPASKQELHFLWTISPPGLEDFFKSVGRPRRMPLAKRRQGAKEGTDLEEADESAPEPFDRPAEGQGVDQQHRMKA
jgi:quercetin dioxygenase-like cupin family protein